MRFGFDSDVAAPLDQVRYVLDAIDEYPAWNSLTRGMPDDVRWSSTLPRLATANLGAKVVRSGYATRVRIGRPTRLCIDHDVTISAAGMLHTEVHVETTTSGPLAFLANRAALLDSVERFCRELSCRARWLPQAPDTRYSDSALGAIPPRSGQNASLEQLLSFARELEGGIFAIDAGSSCCLVDVARQRFLRAEPHADFAQLVNFARWHSFERIVCEGRDVVIVPGAGAAPIRIRPRVRASAMAGSVRPGARARRTPAAGPVPA